VKAVEKKLKFTKEPNDPDVFRYVMSPEQYSSLNQKKVIREAALRSGVNQGVMKACWDAPKTRTRTVQLISSSLSFSLSRTAMISQQ
jgi:hypothetical protein